MCTIDPYPDAPPPSDPPRPNRYLSYDPLDQEREDYVEAIGFGD